MLSKPEFDWECRGFRVNEGPAVLVHGEQLFVSYSASATDENYCMGLLWIDLLADPRARRTGINRRSPYFAPAMRIISMAPATTVLRKRRKGKMCWSTMRGTIPGLKAIRCTIRIAIRGSSGFAGKKTGCLTSASRLPIRIDPSPPGGGRA